MLTSLFISYLESDKTTYTESELNPLISRVYQVISSILKIKYKSENYNNKQIEEEAIEFTALLCMKDKSGIPLIIVNMKRDLGKTDDHLDFGFMLYDRIKKYLELL